MLLEYVTSGNNHATKCGFRSGDNLGPDQLFQTSDRM